MEVLILHFKQRCCTALTCDKKIFTKNLSHIQNYRYELLLIDMEFTTNTVIKTVCYLKYNAKSRNASFMT